jgi:hypothetical protein
MKKTIILLCIGLIVLFISSCKDYLDKSPESTFTEEEVFSNYSTFKTYFDGLYKGKTGRNTTATNYQNNTNIFVNFNLYFGGIPRHFSHEQMTDLSDAGWIRENASIKGGNLGNNISLFYDDGYQRPIFTTSFHTLRIANMALEKVHLLKDVSKDEIDDIIAQSHFCRAFSHFALFRYWGPMPYITKVIGPDDQWDIPRLSKYETCRRIAADLDTAATIFERLHLMRRDVAGVGEVGHLSSPDQFRPNGTLCKALKGRVLLYAASPLNNKNGIKDWEDAAKANWEAIQIALQNGFFLLPKKDYQLNWVGSNYTDEQFWTWTPGLLKHDDQMLTFLSNGVFSASANVAGDSPTQNCVDKFETAWGDPLDTQADRDAATALGHYKEQDPYKNREPRFYIDIMYNEAPIPGYVTAKIYTQTVNGVITYSELLDQKYPGITNTGYYERKLWGGQSVKNNIAVMHSDPFIRLAELYLNYAEAANEAYGPNTPAPGANLTAVQAINIVRQRIGHVDVQSRFTTSTEAFRPRIKNERTIELAFEGHYYFDERRWMDAPVAMGGPLMGMAIEKVPVSSTYPIGYKHTRVPLNATRQSTWKPEMYYLPFKQADYFKMKKFDATLNPRW